MLLAVNCGWWQSPSLVLSRRRSMRRLRLASLRCRVAFTRNPSGHRVLETLDTISNPGKAERFRVFQETPPPTTGGFACFKCCADKKSQKKPGPCPCPSRLYPQGGELRRKTTPAPPPSHASAPLLRLLPRSNSTPACA